MGESTNEPDPDLASLIAGLRSRWAETVRTAAAALGELGPAAAPAVPALARALSAGPLRPPREWMESWDDSPGGRSERDTHADQFTSDAQVAAARALGAIGPDARRAIPALVRAVLEGSSYSDMDETVQGAALDALYRIGPESVPELYRALATPAGRTVGPEIEDTLEAFDAAAVPHLLEVVGDEGLPADLREHARGRILGHGAKALPPLIECLAKARGRAFVRAAEVLGQLGPAAVAAVPALRACLRSRSADRQEAARAALARIDPAAGPTP